MARVEECGGGYADFVCTESTSVLDNEKGLVFTDQICEA